ncbi:16858_t:CDS:2 [Rhizophagus irregularis]|nr:16858_t:CDS:2 [Rhizophagus irregularis]
MSIRYATPTYRHECFTNITEQLASPNILPCQQTNVPTETIDNEIFSRYYGWTKIKNLD